MNQVKLSIDDYLEREFPPGSSRPTKQTIRNMIRRNELNGRKIGHRWYIITEITTGNQECDEILRAIS
tara:strand:+ start:1846 stop:2049 length:204 start_codon:yes stop_codon:yes gene_type:complete